MAYYVSKMLSKSNTYTCFIFAIDLSLNYYTARAIDIKSCISNTLSNTQGTNRHVSGE
jgi:hypothetical protein